MAYCATDYNAGIKNARKEVWNNFDTAADSEKMRVDFYECPTPQDIFFSIEQTFAVKNGLTPKANELRLLHLMQLDRRDETEIKKSVMMDKIKLYAQKAYHAIVLEPADLAKAMMQNTFEKIAVHMDSKAASNAAHNIIPFFGEHNWIIDNILTREERSVFYQLEDDGLLETDKEETTLIDDKGWTICYWLLKVKKIMALALRYDANTKTADDEPVGAYTTMNPQPGSLEDRLSRAAST